MAQHSLQDAKGRPVVVVTGIGVITPLGQGTKDNWAALIAGQSGIRAIRRFPTDGLRTTVAGTIDFMGLDFVGSVERSEALAVAVVKEAIAQAGIGTAGHFPGALLVATPPSEFEWPQLHHLFQAAPDTHAEGYKPLIAAARSGQFANMASSLSFASIAENLAVRFGTRGQPISICTACASGTTTIAVGVETIRRGDADAVICVGTDATVHVEGIVRFSLLSALSTRNDPPEKASRPFSKDRDGFVVGEGAAALVLESYEAAKARGATILGVVRGIGEKADLFHRTRSKPDGSAIIGAIRKTLDDASLAPQELGYVNAHGTSTQENDKMEYLSLKAVLGDHLAQTPVSSNKSQIGHTLIAAGAVEAVFSVLTLQTGVLPPTINYDMPDPDIPLDVVPNTARETWVKTALTNSFGFGGQNACLLFSSEPV
jgi:3-oxoacyl-[acyl-carrier-protein] synthase II